MGNSTKGEPEEAPEAIDSGWDDAPMSSEAPSEAPPPVASEAPTKAPPEPAPEPPSGPVTLTLGSSDDAPARPKPPLPARKPKPPLPPPARTIRPGGTLSPVPPSVRTPLAGPRRVDHVTTIGLPPVAPEAGVESTPSVTKELGDRAERLRPSDPLGAARALVERGVYEEWSLGDRAAARASYEAAWRLERGHGPALLRLRRTLDERKDAARILEVLGDELGVTEAESGRADRLAERARACVAVGKTQGAIESYRDALRLDPHHAASLRALELCLRSELGRAPGKPAAEALAAHLLREAEAYTAGGATADVKLAAWLHVERAELLEGPLADPAKARGALEEAIGLSGGPGPVREALRWHLIRQRDDEALVVALREEAEREPNAGRAARLLYRAGRLLVDRLGRGADGARLFEGAASRSHESAPTSRRALDALVVELHQIGDVEGAARARERRLSTIADPTALAHEQATLAELYESSGDMERVAIHAAAALAREPHDVSTRERLDGALARLGRHEERVLMWLGLAQAEGADLVRVEALRRAANVEQSVLRRPAAALTHLRAAWTIDSASAEVLGELSALLTPASRDPEADARQVRSRIDLYTQAAQAEREPERRVALLEKVVSIWEDELAQPTRAIEVLGEILRQLPKRRTAILALERNAARAGLADRQIEALLMEADLTVDVPLRVRLFVRAAELLLDRVGDAERAIAQVERALALDATDERALRLKLRVAMTLGRHPKAREALLGLVARDRSGPDAFRLWVEIARLDEHRRRRPGDAVDSYRKAAALRPNHPLPKQELSRLLRAAGDHLALADTLKDLAKLQADPSERAMLLFQAAEVEELLASDDRRAAATLSSIADDDVAVFEALETIFVRQRDQASLIQLYTRRLEEHPSAHMPEVRLSLARELSARDAAKARPLLEPLVQSESVQIAALRQLERLQREALDGAALAESLRFEASILSTPTARCAALWELATLGDAAAPMAALGALQRILVDAPTDTAALDATARLAALASDGPASSELLATVLRARQELCSDAGARSLFELERALLAEGVATEAHARAALTGHLAALNLAPESLLAARGVERLSQRLGERGHAIVAARALARLAHDPVHRAEQLVRAADLSMDHGAIDAALSLYEEALSVDPDAPAAASALVRMLVKDAGRLVDDLMAALERTKRPEQVALLGTSIAHTVLVDADTDAVLDVGLGVRAMQRALELAPDDAPSHRLMAQLHAAQGLFIEAAAAWQRVVALAVEPATQAAAHFELSTLYMGSLANPARARVELEAVLAVDPRNPQALERLFQVANSSGDHAAAVSALGRLAASTLDPTQRADIDVRLASACDAAGDREAAVGALCDALLAVPDHRSAWSGLAAHFKLESVEGAQGYAAALAQLIALAQARQIPCDSRWLVALGQTEIKTLRRPEEGVYHLRQAAALPSAGPDVRAALGLGLLAFGRNAECVDTLRDLLTRDSETFARIEDLPAALAGLESALATSGRADERLAVEEVRACLGEVAPERARALALRWSSDGPHAQALAGPALAPYLLPEARLPMIGVAQAVAPVAAKILRFETSGIGLSTRERISARDAHPTRLIAERIARALGVDAFELYLSPTWQGAARIYPGDPCVLVGSTSFAELPEPEQAYALGRLLVRAALGLTWLDELSVEAGDGLLLAAVRAIEPTFASGELSGPREQATQSFAAAVQRAIGRRQKKALEEVVAVASPAYDARAFAIAIRRSEYLVGYLLAGNALAAIAYLRRFDREIARSAETPRVLLQHPVTNEILRYAMTQQAYEARRVLGTLGPIM